jgi:hypothetical protein
MTDYADLIERLRTEKSNPDMDNDAADAIEALEAEVAQWEIDHTPMQMKNRMAHLRRKGAV